MDATSSVKPLRTTRRWGWLLLVALPLALFGPLVFGGRVLYWGLYLLQFHPWRQLAVELIRAGQWPLWNPYSGNGAPLAANLQSAVFYPLNALFLVFPVERALGYSVVLHLILAGLFMDLYGRSLGLSRFARLIAALSFMLSGYIVAHVVALSMVNAIAWLPLLFCLTERLVQRRHARWVLALAIAVALQGLAGHAQTWFYSLVAVSLYALVRAGQEARGRLQIADRRLQIASAVSSFAFWLLSLILGLALAAVQMVPTWELTRLSQRSTGPEASLALEYSFWPWRLITLLAPDFFGHPARNAYWGYGNYWEDCGYVGVLPLILAWIAVAVWVSSRYRRAKAGATAAQGGNHTGSPSPQGNHTGGNHIGGNHTGLPLRLVPFFSLLAFVALLLAFGKNLPLYSFVARWVPGFGMFQAPARLLLLYTFGVSTLAGIGAHRLRPGPTLKRMARYALPVGGALLIGALVTWPQLPAQQRTFAVATARLAVLMLLSAGLLAVAPGPAGDEPRPRWQPSPGAWRSLAVALVIADLFTFGYGLQPTIEARLYHQPVATAQTLRSEPAPFRIFVAYPFAKDTYRAYVSLRSFGPPDVAYWQGLRERLIPNLNVPQHLSSVDNYDPLLEAHYQRVLWALQQRPLADNGALLDALNVRYVLTGDARPGQRPLYDAGGVKVYRRDSALPRAYVVPQARVIPDEEQLLAALLSPDFDPRREVLLSAAAAQPPAPPPSASAPDYRVSILHYRANAVTIEADLPAGGYLILADTYYPGWRAYVDGREQPVLRADYAVRAVALEAGQHTVVFRYRPVSFRIGAAISALALLGTAWSLVASMRRRKGRRESFRERTDRST